MPWAYPTSVRVPLYRRLPEVSISENRSAHNTSDHCVVTCNRSVHNWLLNFFLTKCGVIQKEKIMQLLGQDCTELGEVLYLHLVVAYSTLEFSVEHFFLLLTHLHLHLNRA